ncbi:hypothetical protein [Streptomyces cirratus]|uniref:hypothetical protein n=1 Tax=Streptomyces cirratus TaxID=68187 RepID=UPI003619392C
MRTWWTSTRVQEAIFHPAPRLHIARRETFTLTDQIRTIDIDAQYVIGDPGDHLVKTDVAQVEFALARLLQLHAEPDL